MKQNFNNGNNSTEERTCEQKKCYSCDREKGNSEILPDVILQMYTSYRGHMGNVEPFDH